MNKKLPESKAPKEFLAGLIANDGTINQLKGNLRAAIESSAAQRNVSRIRLKSINAELLEIERNINAYLKRTTTLKQMQSVCRVRCKSFRDKREMRYKDLIRDRVKYLTAQAAVLYARQMNKHYWESVTNHTGNAALSPKPPKMARHPLDEVAKIAYKETMKDVKNEPPKSEPNPPPPTETGKPVVSPPQDPQGPQAGIDGMH